MSLTLGFRRDTGNSGVYRCQTVVGGKVRVDDEEKGNK